MDVFPSYTSRLLYFNIHTSWELHVYWFFAFLYIKSSLFLLSTLECLHFAPCNQKLSYSECYFRADLNPLFVPPSLCKTNRWKSLRSKFLQSNTVHNSGAACVVVNFFNISLNQGKMPEIMLLWLWSLLRMSINTGLYFSRADTVEYVFQPIKIHSYLFKIFSSFLLPSFYAI